MSAYVCSRFYSSPTDNAVLPHHSFTPTDDSLPPSFRYFVSHRVEETVASPGSSPDRRRTAAEERGVEEADEASAERAQVSYRIVGDAGI